MISEFMRNIILEYKKQGLTANQAATQAEVNYRTARRIYEEADVGRIEREIEKKPAKRVRKRDQYKDFILEELQAYPAFSAKQLYDKLKRKLAEEGKEIEVSVVTFRRAIREVRIDNNIPKPKSGHKVRVYRAVSKKASEDRILMDFGGKDLKVVYPAIFKPFSDGSGGYVVEFPDLPGCVTEGRDLVEAIEMGIDVASGWILGELEDGEPVPPPSDYFEITIEDHYMINMLLLDITAYAEKYGER